MRTDMPAGSIWERLTTPLIALVLGILPIWLFMGFGSRTVVNGRVVQDDQFNVLGLVLALIGISMAIRVLRGEGVQRLNWWPRRLLAVLALLVCVGQVGLSAGLYRLDGIPALFAGPVAQDDQALRRISLLR
jgi:hypothetical protein